MSIWDSYTDGELFAILECDNFNDIKKRVTRRFAESEWITAARQTYRLIRRRIMSPASIFCSLQDATNASMLVLLAVIGSITVAFIPLTIMTGVLAVVGMASGIFLMTASYFKEKEKIEKTISKLDFNAIKILCADELLQRQRIKLASHLERQHLPVILPRLISDDDSRFEYTLTNRIQKSASSVGFGLLTGATFFATYYCGFAIALNAFGALAVSAAMLGPIGMGVALAVGIGVGIFCAYQYYQSSVRKEKVSQFKEFQKEKIKDKRWDCNVLSNQTRNMTVQDVYESDRQSNALNQQIDAVDVNIESYAEDHAGGIRSESAMKNNF